MIWDPTPTRITRRGDTVISIAILLLIALIFFTIDHIAQNRVTGNFRTVPTGMTEILVPTGWNIDDSTPCTYDATLRCYLEPTGTN